MQANQEKFKEAKGMCQALEELMKEEFDEKRSEGEKIGEERGRKIGEERGRKIGEEYGEKRGRKLGENLINELNQKLAQVGRMDDILKAAGDKEYQDSLIKEFGL